MSYQHGREHVDQLAAELGARVHALAVLGGPEAVARADRWTRELVDRIVPPLLSDDDHQVAEAVLDIMVALWPDGCEPPAEWWRTPVGRVVARSIGAEDSEAVTHSVAAAMLGVSRGSIGQMVARGHLDRHPDGGVLRSSVLQRLARQV